MSDTFAIGNGRPPAAGSSRSTHKVPPHNLDAERAILGAMLLSRDAIAEAVNLLKDEHFYHPSHGLIYEAICSLYAKGEPADAITVSAELNRHDLSEKTGGNVALVELQTGTPAAANAAKYVNIVYETAMLRKLIEVGGEITELGYEGTEDVVKTVDTAESMVYQLAANRMVNTTASITELLPQNLDRIEQLYEKKDAITGLPTGFIDLDDMTGGLQPSTLVVVGARPAVGKTSFALSMATHAAMRANKPVLIFSLEMSQIEISQRMLCSEARVDGTRIRKGNLTDQDWTGITNAITKLSGAPIWIDDNAAVTMMEIRGKARRLRSQVGSLGMVVVDYLQLMTGRSAAENRQVEVAEISRGLKTLARELNCPVLALSQLSRNLEQRQDKRPMLADLRESGSIEQDADIVMFLYRDEVHNPETTEKGVAEVIVAKHRNGPTGKTKLSFVTNQTRFANISTRI
ncbi:MAG: replicative DNA helicase [Acidimicrobiia bacterium]|nr:replicative DNA helicase [Acidimicrobiia bacterium]MYC58036.1 replicative DNA helicase [Acidimicrobiia bacterium]MYI30791.1 replicative DNA helicase [Acidimicrobiia bacterium]